MPDYKNGKIYTIRSFKTDDIYIGSTTQQLSVRLADHNKKLKLHKNGKYGNMTSFQIIKHGDAYIELLEDYPCQRRDQLHAREGHHIREMKCVNRAIAGRDKKQYYTDNKDDLDRKKKQYYTNNKDVINQKKKQYYLANIEVAKMYQRQYRIDNKDDLDRKKKQYYKDNKDLINHRRTQKHDCPCGGKYTTGNKGIHFKRKLHTNYEALKQTYARKP